MPVTKNELLDFVLHVTNEDNITLFNALLRFPSRLNYGHMRQLVRLTGPIGAAIYADQTVAMEALTKRFDQRAMEIEDAIKEAEQNLEQYQRQHSEALPPDAIDLPKLTKQNVSSILILKGRHPDTIILYRKDDAYIAIAEDSTVLHKVTKLPLKKSEKASVCGFHVDRLDKYLPMLIKAGHRVSVCDKLEEPKKVKESLNSQE
jgi:DNA mismatch repair ATPase MutS